MELSSTFRSESALPPVERFEEIEAGTARLPAWAAHPGKRAKPSRGTKPGLY